MPKRTRNAAVPADVSADDVLRFLVDREACDSSRSWFRACVREDEITGAREAWAACEDPWWLLWAVGNVWPDKRSCVRLASASVAWVADRCRRQGVVSERIVDDALLLSRRWLAGKVSVGEVREAYWKIARRQADTRLATAARCMVRATYLESTHDCAYLTELASSAMVRARSAAARGDDDRWRVQSCNFIRKYVSAGAIVAALKERLELR